MQSVVDEQVIGSLGDAAALLAGFGFTGFVLLLDRIGSHHTQDDMTFRASPNDPEGRSTFLLGAAFAMGVMSAFLLATTTQQPNSLREGFVLGTVAFGLMVMSLAAAVVVLITRYVAPPGPVAAWGFASSLIVFSFIRVAVEMWWARPDGTLSATVFTLLAIGPFVGGGLALQLGRLGRLPASLERPLVETAYSVLRFAAFMTVLGVGVGLAHTAMLFKEEPGFAFPATIGLSILVASMSTVSMWSLFIAWPGAESELESSGSAE